MLGLFKGKEEKQPEWLDSLNETKIRWFTFLNRLEEKMQELCEAAIPELEETFKSDDDPHGRTYHRLLAGIKGQLDNIRQKAYDTYDEKVLNTYYSIERSISVMSLQHDLVHNFRNECSDRYHKEFDNKLNAWRSKLDETGTEDLEIKYKAILDEYESIKDSFSCRQCGAKLNLDKIFFITTYIACPHCQSQNTFEPSSQARGLESLGRSLAEQRTAHLLAAYNDALGRERELYHQRHKASLATIHEGDKKKLAETEQLLNSLEAQRQQCMADAPPLYEKYLRAMFDEWNKIVPDLAAHNEKFYDRQLEEFRYRNS